MIIYVACWHGTSVMKRTHDRVSDTACNNVHEHADAVEFVTHADVVGGMTGHVPMLMCHLTRQKMSCLMTWYRWCVIRLTWQMGKSITWQGTWHALIRGPGFDSLGRSRVGGPGQRDSRGDRSKISGFWPMLAGRFWLALTSYGIDYSRFSIGVLPVFSLDLTSSLGLERTDNFLANTMHHGCNSSTCQVEKV